MFTYNCIGCGKHVAESIDLPMCGRCYKFYGNEHDDLDQYEHEALIEYIDRGNSYE